MILLYYIFIFYLYLLNSKIIYNLKWIIFRAGRQKITIFIRMQFLNDIIKSRHGFKTAQKFHKFKVFIKIKN